MHILLLGGTKFIGRHLASELLGFGHQVSIFARGKTPDELSPHVERLRGDRDQGAAGLESLRGRRFDACVDISGYLPTQVRPAAELLASAVSRYLFISTGAVYRASRNVPLTEEHALLDPAREDVTEINSDTYGPLKVTCEAIVREVYGSRATIVRPQIVTGPCDPYGRYSRWVRRAMQPGPMLLPGDGEDFVQVVDVRDVACLVRLALEKSAPGIYQAAGPRIDWKTFAHVLGVQQPVWVPSTLLQQQGITEQQLPLYRARGSTRSEGMHMSSAKSEQLGVRLHSPADTCDSVRRWIAHDPTQPALSAAREQELIALARAQPHIN
jgi:2'-hydroxyisoflavone reductase